MRSAFRLAVLIFLVMQIGAVAAPQTQPAVEAEDLPRPEKAIVFDLNAPFTFTHYGDENTTVDRMSALEKIGGGIRMTAGDPQAIRVWHYNPRLPILVARYPIMVLRYRAIRQGGPWYNLWIGGRTPDNQGSTAVVLAEGIRLIDDGTERELRVDMRDHFQGVAIQTILIGVHSKTEAPGVLEYLDLRFEAAEGAEMIPLPEEPAMQVDVVDEAGDPVAGATVIVDAERRNFARRGVTDGAGRATITPLGNESGTHMVRVVAEGYVPFDSDKIQPGQGTQVKLEPASGFSGTVQTPDGKPLAGASVNVHIVDRRSWPQRQWGVITDEAGRFSLPLLPATVGQMTMEVRHADYLPASETIVENTPWIVELRQGRAVVTLQPGVSVSGRVFDAAGKPATGNCYITAGQGEPRAGIDAQGRFTVRGLTPGRAYTLSATFNNKPHGTAAVTAEEGASVEIRLDQ